MEYVVIHEIINTTRSIALFVQFVKLFLVLVQKSYNLCHVNFCLPYCTEKMSQPSSGKI